jgi:hypothetical protein
VTTLLHPLLAVSVISFGQVRTQAAVMTVTVKLQVVLLFEASVALQVTVVMPKAKLEPEGGLQVTCTSCVQLSVAVGVV